jgi:hypothetical protein
MKPINHMKLDPENNHATESEPAAPAEAGKFQKPAPLMLHAKQLQIL